MPTVFANLDLYHFCSSSLKVYYQNLMNLLIYPLQCPLQNSILRKHCTINKGITEFKFFILGGIMSDIRSEILVLLQHAREAVKHDFRPYIR